MNGYKLPTSDNAFLFFFSSYYDTHFETLPFQNYCIIISRYTTHYNGYFILIPCTFFLLLFAFTDKIWVQMPYQSRANQKLKNITEDIV